MPFKSFKSFEAGERLIVGNQTLETAVFTKIQRLWEALKLGYEQKSE
jgi:hypothetical protein